ncbi:MAG TPA: putative leader peptide [Pseudonocardia sp.]
MTTMTTALEHSPGALLVSRMHVDLRRQASAMCTGLPHPA